MSRESPFERQSRGKMPENWPFALRHEHNLCKGKSCMEKCLPRLQRRHGSLKGTVSPISDGQSQLTERWRFKMQRIHLIFMFRRTR